MELELYIASPVIEKLIWFIFGFIVGQIVESHWQPFNRLLNLFYPKGKAD